MRDRIRGAAPSTPARQADEVLQQVLAMPSIAAQLLTAAADHLTTHTPAAELTIAGWGRALALADARVLTGYPQIVAQYAARRAMRALSPDLWDSARTRGEWAIALRAIAATL